MRKITLAAAFCLLPVTLCAQWLNFRQPGIPRTPDGKPNLTAPAPRAPDGKPDLSGLWGMLANSYSGNITRDLKPEEIQPWAQALFQQRRETFARDNPSRFRCLPFGPQANLYPPMLEKIVQTPGLMIVLMEDLTFRQVFLDGRALEADPNPTFMGYAVGHWDGDTLVVESNGYNETTWLDLNGHPHSESLRITERFHRRDFGHLDIEETLQDPKIYSRSWTIKLEAALAADTDMIEYVCAENERDRGHLVGKTSDVESTSDNSDGLVKPGSVKLAPEVLARYVGTYECSACVPENPVYVIATDIKMSNGELFANGTRLIPLSDRTFTLAGAGRESQMEFFTDKQGVVTFTRQAAGGEHRYTRRLEPK